MKLRECQCRSRESIPWLTFVVGLALVTLTGCDKVSAVTSQKSDTQAENTDVSCADEWAVGTDVVCSHYPGVGWACLNAFRDSFNIDPSIWSGPGKPQWQGIPDQYHDMTLGYNLACARNAEEKWACVGVDKIQVTKNSPFVKGDLRPTALVPQQAQNLTISGTTPYWTVGDTVFDNRGEGGTVEGFLTLPGLKGVSAYRHTGCAWSAKEVRCWGDFEWLHASGPSNSMKRDGGTYRQWRNESISIQGLPANSIAEVAVGHHACARTADGEVYCWGVNLNGSLGNGNKEELVLDEYPRELNQAVRAKVSEVAEIGISIWHTFVRKKNGEIWSWGGGFGFGSARTLPTPLAAFGSDNRKVLASTGLACVVKESGALVCFGLLQRSGYDSLYEGKCTPYASSNCGPYELLPACVPRKSREL